MASPVASHTCTFGTLLVIASAAKQSAQKQNADCFVVVPPPRNDVQECTLVHSVRCSSLRAQRSNLPYTFLKPKTRCNTAYHDSINVHHNSINVYNDSINIYHNSINISNDSINVYNDSINISNDSINIYHDSINLYV